MQIYLRSSLRTKSNYFITIGYAAKKKQYLKHYRKN